ncbi:MAG: hypothetical protein LH606_15915 [Cytophagaceae bacterium]|nr:hypothetical protein [Cytophagaceae bacterium]
MKNSIKTILLGLLASLGTSGAILAQNTAPTENDYYKIMKVPMPEGTVLEVGGLCALPNGDMGVSTRRGDVYIIENPTGTAHFRKFASGLHEILGLAYKNGSLYCAQRGELTKLTDRNGDGIADRYETVYAWPVSGHYHEYSFGPKIAPDGSFFVTANVAFGNEEWWRGESRVPWRGWTMRITEDGKMEPWATGMRSPCGLGMINGEFYYADNQGDWMGSGFLTKVDKGDFTGHPAGLRWTGRPESPIKMSTADLYAVVDPRSSPKGGPWIKPENNPNETPITLFEAEKKLPEIKTPTVWLPHGILGISTSEIITDDTQGGFGPFAGQVFVGDQGQSKVDRVFLEKVNGVDQGASFPFREGFQSGVLRMAWGTDNSLFVGQTNRGWGSTGKDPFGLQRLVWTGKMPFEMKAIRAMPDGFEVEFTLPVDRKTAEDLANYQVTGFIYKYHPVYGSPVVNDKVLKIKGVKVADDGSRVRVVVDGLREKYIHELKLEGIRSQNATLPLLHNTGYYTLNSIPSGEKLAMAGLSTRNSGAKHDHTAMASVKTTSPDGPAKGATATKPAKPLTGKRITAMPADWGKPDQVIQLGTVPGLNYDKKALTVTAGSKVSLTFNNVDDMPHNFVIVKPGTANTVGETALKMGLKGMELNYVPNTANVIYHTKLIQPGAAETIYFVAPTQPGTYTYVCTYPGHYANMQGTLKVVK